MVTHSVTGALPLGIIITSDEKTQTLIDALSLFKSSLPDYAFFGSSSDIGPKVIMTDNCLELRDSLHHTWPHATLTLCIFHILQQIWRWLYDKNHGINLADRPHMILLVKCVMYASNEDDMIANYDNLRNDSCLKKYPNFMKYFENLYEDCESWALAYRNDLPLRGPVSNQSHRTQSRVRWQKASATAYFSGGRCRGGRNDIQPIEKHQLTILGLDVIQCLTLVNHLLDSLLSSPQS